jgi:acyl-CoA reductase-like NAD-dependent aldehyde dehydrogenase
LKASYPYYLGKTPVTSDDKPLSVIDKFTQQVACKVSTAPADVVRQAMATAAATGPALKKMGAYERKDILLNIAAAIEKREEELIEILAVEGGKPRRDAKVEIMRTVITFKLSAEEAVRNNGTYERLDISERSAGFQSIQARFPAGLVSMITPFNWPLMLAAHKIGPAIAAGCPFVVKPSDRTPITACILGEILAESKLPDGSFAILPAHNDDAAIFSTDPHIKVVSFTGSVAVGWMIKAQAGKKRVLLELGGNAACIVDETANVARAAERIIAGAYGAMGQSCISVQRIFAHKDVFDQLVEKLSDGVKNITHGDPLNPDVFLGPMITEGDAARLESWTTSALAAGAKLIFGGKRDRHFFHPTLLTGVPKSHELHCKEAFGPIAIIQPFTDFKKTIEEVNDGDFGLQAGLFTNDLNRAFYAWNEIDAGGVLINEIPSVRIDSQPYGGIKDSGLGREGVKYAIEEMTELKIMMLKDVGQI